MSVWPSVFLFCLWINYRCVIYEVINMNEHRLFEVRKLDVTVNINKEQKPKNCA